MTVRLAGTLRLPGAGRPRAVVRLLAVVGLVLCLGQSLWTPAASARESAPGFVAANGEAMRSVREAGHLRQDAPAIGLSNYLAFLIKQTQGWLYRQLISILSRVIRIQSLLELVGQLLVWAAIILVLLAAAALGMRLLRRGRKTVEPGAVPSEAPRFAPARDAAAWRAELDRRLAAGDVAGALEASWWWLARSLAAERADPTWTSRELIDHAPIALSERRELLPAVRRLDRLVYGPRQAGVGEVRGFVDELDGSLAALQPDDAQRAAPP